MVMKHFLFGIGVGVLGLLAVHVVSDRTKGWIVQRNNARAASMLIDALTSKKLLCTAGPLRFEGPVVDTQIVVIPRVPLQSIIEVGNSTSSTLLHTVSITGFMTPGVAIPDPPGWIDGGIQAAMITFQGMPTRQVIGTSIHFLP